LVLVRTPVATFSPEEMDAKKCDLQFVHFVTIQLQILSNLG
jgi:hypothetical protein